MKSKWKALWRRFWEQILSWAFVFLPRTTYFVHVTLKGKFVRYSEGKHHPVSEQGFSTRRHIYCLRLKPINSNFVVAQKYLWQCNYVHFFVFTFDRNVLVKCTECRIFPRAANKWCHESNFSAVAPQRVIVILVVQQNMLLSSLGNAFSQQVFPSLTEVRFSFPSRYQRIVQYIHAIFIFFACFLCTHISLWLVAEAELL